MALNIQKQTNFGITVPSCYSRVSSIVLTKKTLLISVDYYADVETNPFCTQSYSTEYNILGDNPLVQAYEHLKTLPEFADAEDV